MCRVSMAAVVVESEDCCCVLVASDLCWLSGDCWLLVVVVLRCGGMACYLVVWV